MRKGKELQSYRCVDTSRIRCAGECAKQFSGNRSRCAFKGALRPKHKAQLQDQKDNGGKSGSGADILE